MPNNREHSPQRNPEGLFPVQPVSPIPDLPAGKSTLYVLAPIANNNSGIDWELEKAAYREKILDILETRGGYTGLRDHIETELMITPKDWEERYGVYKGATFNLGHNLGQMLMFRPHNRFECLKDCYLVGGGTHPGSGLPTIYESGRISAEMILKRTGSGYREMNSLLPHSDIRIEKTIGIEGRSHG